MPVLDAAVIVLDLDDTLYSEADYRVSGLRAACAWVEGLYGTAVDTDLVLQEAERGGDALAFICQLSKQPASVKESLLWVYRLHRPSIALSDPVRNALAALEAEHKVVILTDGRSASQRLKLRALGLDHLPAYISEEYGSIKPEPLRFEQIMRDFPAQNYTYVADNPQKDFIAPNALGWKTIGLRDNGRNVHSQSCEGLSPRALPNQWISTLQELPNSLC